MTGQNIIGRLKRMSTSDKRKLRNRGWLNPINSTDSGWYRWNVSKGDGYIDCDLTIGDCTKQICLDFSAYTKKRVKLRIKKADELIKQLEEIKGFLESVDVPAKDEDD